MAVGERVQNFEFGSAGAATTSNPATSNGQTAAGAIGVSGTGVVNVVAAGSMLGAQYLECTQTTTTASDAYFRWLGYTTLLGSFAFPWQTDTLPSSGTQVFFRSFSGGNSARWLNLSINSTNHMVISVYNGTTDVIVWTSVQTISAATNYRIAGTFSAFATSSTVTLAVNVYTDDFTTLWETGYSGTPTIAGTATNVVDFRFGRNGVTLTGPKFRYDNLRLTDSSSTMYGPINVTVPVTDTAAAADALTVAATVPMTDTGAAADPLTVRATVPLADVGTSSDPLAITAAIPLADTAAASDSLTVTAAVAVSDTATTADTVAVAATVPLADAGEAADTLAPGAGATLADTGTATDALTVTVVVSLTDAGTAVDTDPGVATSITLTDTGVAATTWTVTDVRADPEAIAGHATLAPQPTVVATLATQAVTATLAPSTVTASLEAQP